VADLLSSAPVVATLPVHRTQGIGRFFLDAPSILSKGREFSLLLVVTAGTACVALRAQDLG